MSTILEPVGAILKAVVSTTPLGAAIVSFMNDEQTKNVEDTLCKHWEQISMLKDVVVGELFVNRQKYLEELKATLHQAKDEANEEKRRLYASYLTACCHPDNAEQGQSNRRILLDIVERIDFTGVCILKDLTTKFNGKGVDYFSRKLSDKLNRNDVMVQLDFLTSCQLIEKCSQEEMNQFHSARGNIKPRSARVLAYYKRTVLGDNLYNFISKGII